MKQPPNYNHGWFESETYYDGGIFGVYRIYDLRGPLQAARNRLHQNRSFLAQAG